MKALGRISPTDGAYVCLLLGFVALGTFVYALATGSAVVGILGAGLVVLTVATVVGFRVGARRRAQSNDSGIPIEAVNVWARPLRREQIERYLRTYRGVQSGNAASRTVTLLRDRPAATDRRAA